MRLFHRVTDIVSANLNDLIERFENPEAMLRQAVREMDDALRITMDRAARVIAQEKLLTRQLADHQRQSGHCQQQAELAVARHDDTTARQAIRRRREHERVAGALTDQLASLKETVVRLRRQVDALKVVHSDARGRLAVLAARQRVAETQRQLAQYAAPGYGSLDAFTRFERWSERIELEEAESAALLDLTGGWEPEVFAQDDAREVEAELEALKQSSAMPRNEP